MRELESLLKVSEARCAKLEYKLQDLLRRVFGPKNEKLNPAQRALFGLPAADELPPAAPTATTSATSAAASRKMRGGRRPKPEHLPVVREVIDLPEAQRAGLVKIREEITEQIEYRPSLFLRRQIVIDAGSDCGIRRARRGAVDPHDLHEPSRLGSLSSWVSAVSS